MQSDDRPKSSLQLAAANWLARRDRGLTPAEQDAYLQWLRESPAHAAEIARLELVWAKLDDLQTLAPRPGLTPNPDLLASTSTPRRRMASIRWLLPTGLAAAAAIAVTFFTVFQTRTLPDAPMRHSATIVHPASKRLALEDGSFVDLKAGAEFDTHFTPELRSLRLTCGEAHFTVAKDASRPFVVSVNNYTVRAVGTAFSIQVKDEGVSVLVTEGKVQLDEHANTQAGPNAHELSKLVAGQEAIIRSSAGRETQLLVRELSPAELERATAWQAVRLEFVDLPLRDVIAEFNRHNHRKLALEDTATGNILVGGTFRADNLDGFVRLLQLGFGVSAQTTEQDTIVLRKN